MLRIIKKMSEPVPALGEVVSFREGLFYNGVKWNALTVPKALTVSVRLTVHVGARDQRETEQGLAHLLEHILFNGKGIPLLKFGAEFNAETTLDYTSYYCTIRAPYYLQALSFLYQIVNRPEFTEEILAREKEIVLNELLSRGSDPLVQIFNVELPRKVLRGNSLCAVAGVAQIVGGIPEQIQNFTLKQVREFYERYYHPNRFTLSLAGALPEDLPSSLTPFAHLTGKVELPFSEPLKPLKPLPSTPQIFFYKEGLEQAVVSVAYPYQNSPTLEAVVKIAGVGLIETVNAYFYRRLRLERGFTYNVQRIDYALAEVSVFAFYFLITNQPEIIREVLDLLLADLAHLQREGLSEQEFIEARSFLLNQAITTLEEPNTLTEYSAQEALKEEPVDYLSRYRLLSELPYSVFQRELSFLLNPAYLTIFVVQ